MVKTQKLIIIESSKELKNLLSKQMNIKIDKRILLLSNKNITQLQGKGYWFIIGARIKNEKNEIKEKILALKIKNG